MTFEEAIEPGSATEPPAQPERRTLARFDVRAIFRGAREVILLHGTEEYRLKLTAAGKLILTK